MTDVKNLFLGLQRTSKSKNGIRSIDHRPKSRGRERDREDTERGDILGAGELRNSNRPHLYTLRLVIQYSSHRESH